MEKEMCSDVVKQLVDGIMGKESENPTEKEQEARKRLSGRALEYLMFMEETDDIDED